MRTTFNPIPEFIEKWYHGEVEYEGKTYYYWVVHSEQMESIEIRWKFKGTPRAIVFNKNLIIENFQKDILHG